MFIGCYSYANVSDVFHSVDISYHTVMSVQANAMTTSTSCPVHYSVIIQTYGPILSVLLISLSKP
jgi:hypothetical protein